MWLRQGEGKRSVTFYLESKYWTVSLPGVEERGQKGGISKEQLVEIKITAKDTANDEDKKRRAGRH